MVGIIVSPYTLYSLHHHDEVQQTADGSHGKIDLLVGIISILIDYSFVLGEVFTSILNSIKSFHNKIESIF